MGDQNRLIQIMTNFISNAYKYTPTGGMITITRGARPATSGIQQGAAQVIHCFVRDTGIGMSEDDLQAAVYAVLPQREPARRASSPAPAWA